jgi:nucleoside-diphosphate-sugar epimerase
MVGTGKNVKSMAYVENVAAFLLYSLGFGPGVHVYNYVDKPDFDMQALVDIVHDALGRKRSRLKLPYAAGLLVGAVFDLLSKVTGRKFPISSIRIRKFCANTMFNTNARSTGFIPPVSLRQGLADTIRYEFIEDNSGKEVFFSEQ